MVQNWMRKSIIFLFVFSLLITVPIWTKANSQQKIDGIEQLLKISSEAERGTLFLSLSEAYGFDDPEKAYYAAEQAVELANLTKNQPLLAKGFLLMGQWKRFIGGDIDQVYFLLNQARKLAQQQQNTTLQCDVLYQLTKMAWWEYNRTKYDSILAAIGQLKASIKGPEQLGKIAFMNAVKSYQDYETELAIDQYDEAIQHYEAAGYIDGLIDAYMHISAAHQRLRLPEEADKFSRKALTLAEKNGLSYWTLRLKIQDGLAITYGQNNSDSAQAQQVLNDIESLAAACRNQFGLLKYNYFKARRLRDTNAGDLAIPFGEEFLRISKRVKLNSGIIQASFFLCVEYNRQGLVAKALEYALAVKELATTIDYRVERLYSLISRLYKTTGEYYKALEIRQQSVSYRKAKGTTLPYYFFYFYYSDYADIYAHLDEIELATIYQDSALLIARENDATDKIISALIGKGDINLRQGDYLAAEQGLKEAFVLLKNATAGSDLKLLPNAHGFGLELYYNMQAYEKCIFHGEKALETSSRINWNKGLLHQHEMLYKAYEALGQDQKALYHIKEYNAIRDSIFNAEITTQFLVLREKYESEQKQLDIDLLIKGKVVDDLLLKSKEYSLQRSQLLLWILGIGAIILAILGWLFFNRYKLRRKAQELKLQNKQFKLEQENIKTMQQLEMVELRSSFLANVSHEIRTPLTLIKGPLEQWKKNPELISSEAIESIDNNADRLIKLVNEAMDVASAETVTLPLKLKVVNASDFFEQQFNSFKAQAVDQNVSLLFHSDKEIIMCAFDVDRLERVILNLVSNAFRYTPAGGTISLTLKCKESHLNLLLADTGKGIEKEHLPYIFDRYYRATNDETTGYGIGLAIVKEVISIHNGTISVKSELGIGTTFSIQLPIADVSKNTINAVPSNEISLNTDTTSVESTKPTVLLVEDNLEVKQYLVGILSKRYNVHTAVDGVQGEDLALKLSPDIIVSDVMMPRKNGFELVQSLKNKLLTSHIPILLLTAKAAHKDKLQGLEVGADYYLLKPFSPDELLLCMRNLLNQQERLRQQFIKAPIKQATSVKRSKIDESFLEKAKSVVDKHLDNESLSVELFSSEMALNRTSIHLKIKALTGMNTTSYIKSIRIAKAAELIIKGEHQLSEVAEMTGFSNRQSFNRAFKEQQGVPPSVFRKTFDTESLN